MLKINIILGSSGNELIKWKNVRLTARLTARLTGRAGTGRDGQGKMERFSKLVCENLIACPEFDSGSGLWERIIMEERRSQRVEKSNGRRVEDMK